jgi:serine/threonine-protein kinase 11
MAEVLAPITFIADHRIIEAKHREQKKVNQYAFVQTIGQGSHGKVYLAVDTETGLPYAVKVIALDGSRDSGASLEREVRLLRRLDHPNIVTLREVLHTKRQEAAYIVLEWASFGSLAAVIQNGLPESVVASVFAQICDGLSYLHRKSIVHHDVKPSNILLFGSGIAKIGDLGIGHSIMSADSVIGTPGYQAPEFFDDSPDIVLDPVKEDVWSLGVSIFEAVFGRLPFPGANIFEIAWNVLNRGLIIPATASQPLRDLLEGMLDADPATRLSLEQVRAHVFFANAENVATLPVEPRPAPKIPVSMSFALITASVCDDGYTFGAAMGSPRSASVPEGLYGRW